MENFSAILLVFFFTLITIFSCNKNSEGNKEKDNGDVSPKEDGMGMHGMEKMHEMMMDSGRMMMMSKEEMEGMGPEMMQDMRVIHNLLVNHEKVKRKVKNILGGIESWIESEDPEIAVAIQKHVWQMKERVEQGKPIRMMDPVFREIFDHHKEIDLDIENIENGVHVIETSDDPKVTALIRQHAHRAVSELVESGMERAMQPTPLPEGYDYKE